jgi:4-hydroxyacetophenone monooxygenase
MSDQHGVGVGEALEHANLPTLIMCLYHLTGDPAWLRPPYAPSRTKGVEHHDGGGLPRHVQVEVREAAARLLLEGVGVEGASVGRPDPVTAARMLSVCMGDEIPFEYGDFVSYEIETYLATAGAQTASPPDRGSLLHGAEDRSALIVGAGISGIAAAVELKRRGIPFTVLERRGGVGGTWLDNDYPGAGVDTPSHLYSFSYARWPWSRYYAKRAEVLGYLESVVDRFDLREHIIFDADVSRARYISREGRWNIDFTQPGSPCARRTARFLIFSIGQLNRPKVPQLDGMDDFSGTSFHSAQWPRDYDVTGKRVAVVGSGASAMQVVPNIQERAEHVTVLQRSAPWVAPADGYGKALSDEKAWLFANVPFYDVWYRLRQAWLFYDKTYPSLALDRDFAASTGGASANSVNAAHRRHFEDYIRKQLHGDQALFDQVVPDYPPFAKRMLLDNGWYSSLRMPHVDLVTEGVASLYRDGVVTATGKRVRVDTVVFTTGFETIDLFREIEVSGAQGQRLSEVWGSEDPRAYLGVTAPGFPNMFVMYGPNTNIGGGGWVTIAEAQSSYISTLIGATLERGADTIEVDSTTFAEFNSRLDKELGELLWSVEGVPSWYRNAQGHVVAAWPWRFIDYWREMIEPDLGAFVFGSREMNRP